MAKKNPGGILPSDWDPVVGSLRYSSSMPIEISRQQIDATLPRVEDGLQKYLRLQADVSRNQDIHNCPNFRKRFNHFYRVRRGAQWQERFYALFGRARQEKLGFRAVLEALREETVRFEASFASKLVATLNPTEPVIDSVVLKNLGMKLPKATSQNRVEEIHQVHTSLKIALNGFLQTEDGKYLVSQFKKMYPSANITNIKMLDLVLWQTRA